MAAPGMGLLSRSKKAPADGSGSGGACRTLAAAAEAAPATAARLLRSCLRLLLNWSGGPGLGLAARLARILRAYKILNPLCRGVVSRLLLPALRGSRCWGQLPLGLQPGSGPVCWSSLLRGRVFALVHHQPGTAARLRWLNRRSLGFRPRIACVPVRFFFIRLEFPAIDDFKLRCVAHNFNSSNPSHCFVYLLTHWVTQLGRT